VKVFSELSQWYEPFKFHIDRIAKTIVENNDHIVLSFSGGIDCTMILASLLHQWLKIDQIECVHVDLSHLNRYYAFHKTISKFICNALDVPLTILPLKSHNRHGCVLDTVKNHGYKTWITGDGLDRMWCHSYKSNGDGVHFTHGERFRVLHPYIDYLTATIPSMLQVYKKPVIPVHKDIITSSINAYESRYNVRMIRYGQDEGLSMFMHFLANQQKMWQLFHWKPFNKWYITDVLNTTHHDLCTQAYYGENYYEIYTIKTY